MSILIAIVAYLCGSLPTGALLGRLAGVDVRGSGSGNVGATNVARTAGASLGLLTLVVDVLKGALPVILARRLDLSPPAIAVVGLAAFYGHIFSVFSGFRGGKGVATAAGVFAVLAPAALAVGAVVFALVAGVSRVVSAASLAAGLTLPIAAYFLRQGASVLVAAVIVAATLVITHRDNIARLLAGSEGQFKVRGD